MKASRGLPSLWGGFPPEACPNLPMSKKVEVLVEHFYAQGVSLANKSVSTASAGQSNPIDTWVTVTPKKRMKANRTSKIVNSVFSTLVAGVPLEADPPISAAVPSVSPPLHPAPTHDAGLFS